MPFNLVLADITPVRVLATQNVELADALDKKVLISHNARVLSAELIPGETLHAQGHLERGSRLRAGAETGYRDGEYEWQLVPARGRMMLSSEPLGAGLVARAKFHRRYFAVAIFSLVAFQALFANFHARAMASDQPATVLDKKISSYQDSDGHTQHNSGLTLRLPGDKIEAFNVSGSNYRNVNAGTRLAVRKGLWGFELGGGGSMNVLLGISALMVATALMLLYPIRRRATRPWFRRKVRHSGSGQLPGA